METKCITYEDEDEEDEEDEDEDEEDEEDEDDEEENKDATPQDATPQDATHQRKVAREKKKLQAIQARHLKEEVLEKYQARMSEDEEVDLAVLQSGPSVPHARPRGRAPKGKCWCALTGKWVKSRK
jgi:hypothetical protein